jgi:hypothetical protein
MWDALRHLNSEPNVPWLVLGDFNEAMWQEEHFSLTPRSNAQMKDFRDALEDCGLYDLGFTGVPFTYDNKRGGNANVKVRLDRAVANMAWRERFENARVNHLISPCSDHCPIAVDIVQENQQRPRQPRRHYEILWERAPELEEKIKMAWEEAGRKTDLGDVATGLDQVMTVLQRWSKVKFKNTTRELEKARAELELLYQNNADQREIRRVTDHMNELLYREEMLWLQ